MTDISNSHKTTRQLFDAEQIDGIKTALMNAPAPARKLTVRETLEAMSSELKEACARGHNANSLTKILIQSGLSTNERAVARALRASSPKFTKKQGKLVAAATT